MEGSVGLRVDTRTRGGYRALAHRLGSLGCRDHRSQQGGSGALPGTALGLGRLMNLESHSALIRINALELPLSSHSLGLCSQVLGLIAFPWSLCFYTVPY